MREPFCSHCFVDGQNIINNAPIAFSILANLSKPQRVRNSPLSFPSLYSFFFIPSSFSFFSYCVPFNFVLGHHTVTDTWTWNSRQKTSGRTAQSIIPFITILLLKPPQTLTKADQKNVRSEKHIGQAGAGEPTRPR